MKARLIFWIMTTSLYKMLLKHVVPYIRFSMYYPKIKGYQYRNLYYWLQPGDIILTTDRKKLTSIAIPGEWDHAALCVAKGEKVDYEIAEMTHLGYTKSFFFDVCKEADRVLILRCPDFDKDYVERVIAQCKSYQNAIYDSEFKLGEEALYCFELIKLSDFQGRCEFDLSDLAGLGRPYLSGTGIAECKKLSWIYLSDWAMAA